jgi:hypothetical protein
MSIAIIRSNEYWVPGDVAIAGSTGDRDARVSDGAKKPDFRPAFHFLMDARVKPGRDEVRAVPHNTRLLSFTFSASRYTLLPISLNLALIAAIPSSIVPDTDIPTLAGSFSVAA